MTVIETDYLVVGAGAIGMAFTDSLIAESGARSGDGGPAPPAGRALERRLGIRPIAPAVRALRGRLPVGWATTGSTRPARTPALTSAPPPPELCDYYARVLDDHLIPSGQVRFLGMHDYLGKVSGECQLKSLVTGKTTTVRVRRGLVDATYMEKQCSAAMTGQRRSVLAPATDSE